MFKQLKEKVRAEANSPSSSGIVPHGPHHPDSKQLQQEQPCDADDVTAIESPLADSSPSILMSTFVPAGRSLPSLDFASARISGQLNDVFLFKDFCTEMEADALWRMVNASQWTDIKHRRLQCYGGDPLPGAARPSLPSWLSAVAQELYRRKAVRLLFFLVLNNY